MAKQEKQIVVDANPAWAAEGLALARQVRDCLAPVGADVDHIGSTAVANLAAKDVIDLQAVVCDLTEPAIPQLLMAAGFEWRVQTRADFPRPGFGAADDDAAWAKLFFREAVGLRRIHLHVLRFGAANATIALLQRDFLRADADARMQWAALKLALSAHTHDFAVYADLKEPATTLLLRLAQQWAERVRWRPGVSDAPAGGQT